MFATLLLDAFVPLDISGFEIDTFCEIDVKVAAVIITLKHWAFWFYISSCHLFRNNTLENLISV